MKRKHSDGHTSSLPCTRSSTNPLDKNLCFFCQKDTRLQLLNITTEKAGHALRQAVHLSQNAALKTRLCTAISPDDAHAIDVKYHKPCWTEHVFHVLRDSGKVSKKMEYSMQHKYKMFASLNWSTSLTYRQKQSISLNGRCRNHICQHTWWT